jgi:hypothetical protein
MASRTTKRTRGIAVSSTTSGSSDSGGDDGGGGGGGGGGDGRSSDAEERLPDHVPPGHYDSREGMVGRLALSGPKNTI